MPRIAAALAAFSSPIQAQLCAPKAPVAFLNVSILSMDTEALSPPSTVLVRDDKIEAINPASVPADTCRVDGQGQVLMPGLTDMHVHTSEREMPLFLASGVTFIREMNGSPTHLKLRDRIMRGELVGPRMLVASTLLVGKPFPNVRYRLITSVADAHAAAREAKDAGYDFLKIYDGLTVEQYDAFVADGRAFNLRLDGHIPADVGLARALDARQSLQHMDKISFALSGHTMDTAKFAEARRLFRGREAWVTPTLASLRALDMSRSTAFATALQRPEMAYVDSGPFAWWQSLAGPNPRGGQSRWYQYQTSLLRVLRDVNTHFLLGTDAANPLMVAGFSVHDELDALIHDAGFSPMDAIRSATRNVGDFLGDSLTGRLIAGAHADLILVTSNPLVDIAVLRKPNGVMAQGRWFTRAQLDSMLAGARLR